MTRTDHQSPSDTHTSLSVDDIPSPDADWSTISEFALTFNAYEALGSLEACAEIANARTAITLTDLRTCLFFEQRRWRHFGEKPDASSMEYIHAILEKIRARISAGEKN
jgi:hypothetical protein